MTEISLHDDMRARWTPSKDQDIAAFDWLAKHIKAEEVYSIQLLVSKTHSIWTLSVKVLHPEGLYRTREEAYAACDAAKAIYRLIKPGVDVSASWARHTRPWHGYSETSADGRAWLTAWAVFEA